MKEVKIVAIEDQGAITKTNYPRPGFEMPVTYVLEDGKREPGSVFSSRKRDIPQALERTIKQVASGSMKATYTDEGKYFGTVTSYYIGPTPEPAPQPVEPH